MITSLQFLGGLGAFNTLHTLVKEVIDPFPVSDVYCIRNYGRMVNRIDYLSFSQQVYIINDYWKRFEEKYGRESRISHQKKISECDQLKDDGVYTREEDYLVYIENTSQIYYNCKDYLEKYFEKKDKYLEYLDYD